MHPPPRSGSGRPNAASPRSYATCASPRASRATRTTAYWKFTDPDADGGAYKQHLVRPLRERGALGTGTKQGRPRRGLGSARLKKVGLGSARRVHDLTAFTPPVLRWPRTRPARATTWRWRCRRCGAMSRSSATQTRSTRVRGTRRGIVRALPLARLQTFRRGESESRAARTQRPAPLLRARRKAFAHLPLTLCPPHLLTLPVGRLEFKNNGPVKQ